MIVLNLKIEELKPYEKNARVHPKKQVDLLCKNIERFGFTTPVLIDEKNNIIAGHGRLLALKQMGREEVPCVRIEGLTENEIKALRLADNQIASIGEWEMGLAIEELKGLDNELIDLTGFDRDLIIEPNEQDDVIPENVPARSKLGDLYELGQHRVLCGDSTLPEAVLRLMNGKKADMVFTDPPYGVAYSARTGIRSGKIRENMKMIKNDDLAGDDLDNLIVGSLTNCVNSTKTQAPFYVCNNWHCSDVFKNAFSILGLNIDAWIIWNKDWMSVGHGHYRSNHEFIFYTARGGQFFAQKGTEADVWNFRKLSPTNKVHTTEKPVDLVARALKNSSGADDICLDLFLGSGSTLIACEKTGRICYGMELDPSDVFKNALSIVMS